MRSLAERGVLVVAAAQVRDLPSLLNSHELNPLLGALHPVPILLPPSAAMGEAGRRSSGSGGVAAEVTVAGAGVGAGGSGAGRSAGAASTAGVGVGGEDAREGAGSAQVGSEGPLLGPPPPCAPGAPHRPRVHCACGGPGRQHVARAPPCWPGGGPAAGQRQACHRQPLQPDAAL